MNHSPIPPFIGTNATGEHRYSRPELEAEFDSAMSQTNGARLFGLRRIGKSTEALACCERLSQAEPKPVLVQLDAQGCTSEAKLLMDFLKALPEKTLLERFTQAVGSDNAIAQGVREALKKLSGAPADVQAYFAQIMHAVEGAVEAKDGIVLVIDEFPWLCRSILESDAKDGRSRVDVLLAALRRWRVKGVKMLLLGSIGMAALGRQYRLDLNHLNDLQCLETPMLTPDQAVDMVQALVAGSGVQNWTAEHSQQMLDECIALYPAIIQDAFRQLSLGKQAIRLDLLAERFAERIRPDLNAAFFTQFDRRLQFYRQLDEPMPKLLPGLLDAILRQPNSLQTDPELRGAFASVDQVDLGDALSILREDGFLCLRAPLQAPQEWRAASGLVTAWWQQRYGRA